MLCQVSAQCLVQRAVGRLDGLPPRGQRGQLVGEAQANAAVVGTQRTGTHPHQLARCAQLVELGGAVAAQTGRQQIGLQRAGHQRRALQLPDRLHQPVEATTIAGDALPALQEVGIGVLLHRLDLAAQRSQRPAAQLPQHILIAPLAAALIGAELAAHHATLGLQRREGTCGALDGDAETLRQGLDHERAVRARIPRYQGFQRMWYRFGELAGQTKRHVAAQRVAVAGGIVGGDEALLAGHRHADGTTVLQ